jgi:hypothetical protein
MLRTGTKTAKRNQAPRIEATIRRVLASKGNARIITARNRGPPNTISQIYPTASSISDSEHEEVSLLGVYCLASSKSRTNTEIF